MRLSHRLLRVGLVLGVLSCLPLCVPGQSPLHRLNGPEGGIIVYGTVDGASTSPAAMGVVLGRLHQQYGERPVVGRVFKVRGTESDAVFFTLTPHVASMAKVAGMLMVANAPGHMEVALLSDDASRFGTSVNPMLETLFAHWKPGGTAVGSRGNDRSSGRGSAGGMEASAPAAPLRSYRLQDNSAMMGLAEGWRVLPGSGGGTILAQGPRGETLALGFPYLAYDPRNPSAQRMRNFGMSAAGRNTSYAKQLMTPYGADLGRTLMDLNAQARRVGGPSVAPLTVERSEAVRPSGGGRCAIVSGTSAGGQGQGTLQFEGTMCQSTADSSGGFMNLANLAFVPTELASRERATLRAMLGSFQVNQAVVNGQAAALAAPTIAAIHAIGDQVTARIQESDREMDARRTSFEQHNDSMDRTSQGFSNYMLDKSVILDNQNNTHGTAWNSTAEALVKSDPKRFEYVDTPGYWKGVDY